MIPAAAESRDILRRLGVPETAFAEAGLATRSPIDGSAGSGVAATSDIEVVVVRATAP